MGSLRSYKQNFNVYDQKKTFGKWFCSPLYHHLLWLVYACVGVERHLGQSNYSVNLLASIVINDVIISSLPTFFVAQHISEE